jgi:hypothetical protein
MTEKQKPHNDGLRKWLIIDTILSVIFMLYLSSVVLEFVVGTVFVAPLIFVYWFFIIIFCTGLLITSWVLKKREKNTGSTICSIITIVISVICLILGILIKYY